MQAIAPLLVMFSILFPSRTWYAPTQPVEVQIRGAGAAVTLVLVDFAGKPAEGDVGVPAKDGDTVNLRQHWPQLGTPGTYLLLAVPPGKAPKDFVGTPLVIGVRSDKRRDAPPGPMVIKVEPLRYIAMNTGQGDLTMAFYYDVAPNTVASFLTLAEGGYFDGLTFHRIVPGFVIQGGDPRGDGTGGPGYQVDAEFSNREHRPGVLSMARQGDPIERQGAMPRSDAANSAGSQFFICLDYEQTKQLDNRYTAFGKVIGGMDVVEKIAATPTGPNDKPVTPQVITTARVMPVTAGQNPYSELIKLSAVPLAQPQPATQP